jgi:hypothetical protein
MVCALEDWTKVKRPKMKVCSRCNKKMASRMFNVDTRIDDGLNKYCKECQLQWKHGQAKKILDYFFITKKYDEKYNNNILVKKKIHSLIKEHPSIVADYLEGKKGYKGKYDRDNIAEVISIIEFEKIKEDINFNRTKDRRREIHDRRDSSSERKTSDDSFSAADSRRNEKKDRRTGNADRILHKKKSVFVSNHTIWILILILIILSVINLFY